MNDCITPRKMVEILQALGNGTNPYNLAAGIKGMTYDTVAGMQQANDRQTMFEVIRLMQDPNEPFDETLVKQKMRV